MPDNKDIYGNVDRYSLFFDSRSGTYEWYPTQYKKHPIWSQYLTIQISVAEPTLYPSGSLYPGLIHPASVLGNNALPDVSRPMGMHGIGTQRFDPVKTNYIFPSAALYPSSFAFPSAETYATASATVNNNGYPSGVFYPSGSTYTGND